MLPNQNPYGDSTAPNFGLFSLDRINEGDFKAFLLFNGYASTNARANQIWTQAREYYYQDTGTVTARPHKTPVNTYAAQRMSEDYQVTNLFTDNGKVTEYNSAFPDNQLSRRLGSGSADLRLTAEYYQSGGLQGFAVIVCEGLFSFVYVQKNSG